MKKTATSKAKSVKKLAADPPESVGKRTFKTKWFAKEARATGITDAELCQAITEVWAGKADDLGSGVWKKRLNKNSDRSIILVKGKRYWIYTYLFSKSNQPNIDDDELADFKKLAKAFEKLTDTDIVKNLTAKTLIEICHDC